MKVLLYQSKTGCTKFLPLDPADWTPCGRCDCPTCKGANGWWDTLSIGQNSRGIHGAHPVHYPPAELFAAGLKVVEATEADLWACVDALLCEGEPRELSRLARYDEKHRMMRAVKVWYADGNSEVTNINGTRAGVRAYYVGQSFNFGDTDEHPADRMVKVSWVEFLN